MEQQGGCHCGNIRYVLSLPVGHAFVYRRCGCGFCQQQGAVYAVHWLASLRVRIAAPDQVTRYRFASATAEFHICAYCGSYPLVTSEIGGRLFALANANTFDTVPALREVPVRQCDDEVPAERLRRRAATWIGDVAFAEA